MKAIKITIDEPLLDKVDEVVKKNGTTRSAFIRDALRLALYRRKIAQLEWQDAMAYARQPQELIEIEIWESEQVWPDDDWSQWYAKE